MTEFQGWHFQVFQSCVSSDVWFAVAKRDPFLYENGLMAKPGELFFRIGKTGDEALAKLKGSLNMVD